MRTNKQPQTPALFSDTKEPVFYHVDVNSAFLSWSAVKEQDIWGWSASCLPDLRRIPAVIGGNEKNRHGIVLAASIPAKACGIKTGEPLLTARQKCPGLVIRPPDYAFYVHASRQLVSFLKTISPTVFPYSIDEAFLDMSGTFGLYGYPVIFARELKRMIYEKFHFTVNIGVADNMLLAKMAGELKKPDQVNTLFSHEIPKKLWPLPVSELFFVGRSTARKLHSLGIATIGDLARTDEKLLYGHFKKPGLMIHGFANGLDCSELLFSPPKNKGYGNSLTLPFDLTDRTQIHQALLSLCETVGARLRADGFQISVLSVSYTDWEFRRRSHQCTLPSTTDDTRFLHQQACRLFDQFWDHSPVRQLGVHTSRAVRESYRQLELPRLSLEVPNKKEASQGSLENPLQYPPVHPPEKQQQLNQAIDTLRLRYGEDSIFRACFLQSPLSHMTGGIDKEKRTGGTIRS